MFISRLNPSRTVKNQGRRHLLKHSLLSLLAASCLSPAAWAQTGPSGKAIQLVLGIPAGGPLDSLARITSELASKSLGRPVIVENKPGASGAIAVSYLLRQPADGNTLYMTADATFSLIPIVRKMAYRPVEDFTFIGSLVFAPQIFAVPASLPVKTMKEFVAKAKSEPGKLNYGMMLGVPQHLDFERFKKATNTSIELVPYKGGAMIVTAMLGEEVQSTLMNASLFTDWIKQGKVRALATTAPQRMAAFPDIPTLPEAGFPNMNLDEGVAYVLVGPPNMPKAVVNQIYQAYASAVRDPLVQKRLENMGFEVSLRDGETLKADIQKQIPLNEKLVKTLDIKLTD